MRLLKTIVTTFLLTILTANAFATTWAPIYPYIQKTENRKVKSHSFPYGVHNGPYGPGETFVYANEKLLYSINKYFSTPFFTSSNGQYLIEFDFYLNYSPQINIIDDNDKWTTKPIIYDGKAINIYKDGILFKTINFSDLNIDTSKIKVNEFANWFSWQYKKDDSTKDKLKMKMHQNPAFIEDKKLHLITADNQIIIIEISTGQITTQQNAYETLSQRTSWRPKIHKRKYKKVKYPEKFLLPKLQNGTTIEKGLAVLLGRKISTSERDSSTIQIYFHTLLINEKGKCEIVYASPSIRDNIAKDFMNSENDQKLKARIENWIKQQTFETLTFPKDFRKFKYTDFVYLE